MTLVDHPHNLALFVKVNDKDRLDHLIDHMLVRRSKASLEHGLGRRVRTFFDPVTRTVYSCFCHIINRLGCSIDESTRRPVTASLLYIRGWGDAGKEGMSVPGATPLRIGLMGAYQSIPLQCNVNKGALRGKRRGLFTCGAISCRPLHLVKGSYVPSSS